MEKNTFVHRHSIKAENDPGWAAENKRVDHPQICGELPEPGKQEKYQKTGASNQKMVALFIF